MRAAIDQIAAAADPARRVQAEITHPGPRRRPAQRHQDEQRVHPRRVPGRAQGGNRVRPGPDHIGVQRQHHARAQQRQRPAQPAACFQHRVFRADGDILPGEVIFDHMAEIMCVDDNPPRPAIPAQPDGAIQQRLARDLDQGLGAVIGQGPHPRAQTGGKDHQRVGHFAEILSSISGVGAGTAAIMARRSASAGWSRSRIRQAQTRGMKAR